jgi:hypothetical protein
MASGSPVYGVMLLYDSSIIHGGYDESARCRGALCNTVAVGE